MSVLTRLFAARQSRSSDYEAWAAAATIEDLGELTAQWLEGRITHQPGYGGPVDVDEADAPGLTDALIALNRAGVVTAQSQAGYDGPGFDGAYWTQLAWVDALISGDRGDLLDGLQHVTLSSGYQCQASRGAGTRRETRSPGVVVTACGGRPATVTGRRGRQAVEDWYAWCTPDLVDAACEAWQVTVWDPEPGRNDMWAVLHDWAERQP